MVISNSTPGEWLVFRCRPGTQLQKGVTFYEQRLVDRRWSSLGHGVLGPTSETSGDNQPSANARSGAP